MKSALIPILVFLILTACKPGQQQRQSQSIDSLLDDTVEAGASRQTNEEKTGSAKVSFEKSYTAPNGIQFNITTLGDDSLRQMQIIAVKDGLFLTDIMEEITGELIIFRSVERSVGNECVSPCSSRGWT